MRIIEGKMRTDPDAKNYREVCVFEFIEHRNFFQVCGQIWMQTILVI
jgi:hypothetical protein